MKGVDILPFNLLLVFLLFIEVYNIIILFLTLSGLLPTNISSYFSDYFLSTVFLLVFFHQLFLLFPSLSHLLEQRFASLHQP